MCGNLGALRSVLFPGSTYSELSHTDLCIRHNVSNKIDCVILTSRLDGKDNRFVPDPVLSSFFNERSILINKTRTVLREKKKEMTRTSLMKQKKKACLPKSFLQPSKHLYYFSNLTNTLTTLQPNETSLFFCKHSPRGRWLCVTGVPAIP